MTSFRTRKADFQMSSADRQLILDSSQASSGTPEDYTVELGSVVRRVGGLEVTGAMVPKSIPHWDGSASYSNDINFFWNGTAYPLTAAQIGGPNQFTTLSGLAAKLQQVLYDGVDHGFTVASDVLTGRLTISPGSMTGTNWGFTSLSPVLQTITGFTTGYVTTTSMTGTNVADLSYPRYLRLYVEVNGRPTPTTQSADDLNSTGVIPFASANAYQIMNFAKGIYGTIRAPRSQGYQAVEKVRIYYAFPDGEIVPSGAFQGVHNQVFMTLQQELYPVAVGYKRGRAR